MIDVVGEVRHASMVLPVDELEPTLTFFRDLGFQLVATAPADNPVRATMQGFGVRLDLDPDAAGPPGALLLTVAGTAPDEREMTGPNGTSVRIVTVSDDVAIPPAAVDYGVSRAVDGTWTVGRAGLRYRDLVPDRAGGALMASLVHRPESGPLDDPVHRHRIALQLIYCASGWAEVVYEDQGPPFVLEQGDAVLQPPGIAHQVLATSDEFVAVEVTVPADHDTELDPGADLPNENFRPSRRYGGQRFVRHQTDRVPWVPWNGCAELEGQRLRIDIPTNHLATAVALRVTARAQTSVPAARPTTVLVVLDGEASLTCADEAPTTLGVADAVCIPPGTDWELSSDAGTELLLVTVDLPSADDGRPGDRA